MPTEAWTGEGYAEPETLLERPDVKELLQPLTQSELDHFAGFLSSEIAGSLTDRLDIANISATGLTIYSGFSFFVPDLEGCLFRALRAFQSHCEEGFDVGHTRDDTRELKPKG